MTLERRVDLRDEILRRVYDRFPSYELVDSTIPAGIPDLYKRLARLLMIRGEFAGRELALATARGEDAADPSHLTLAPGVKLVAYRLADTTERGLRMLDCELRFELSPEAGEVRPVSLRCDSSGAAVSRPFVPSTEPFHYRFHLHPSFPPGTYQVSLQFDPIAALYPLGSVEIEERELTIERGKPVGAAGLPLVCIDYDYAGGKVADFCKRVGLSDSVMPIMTLNNELFIRQLDRLRSEPDAMRISNSLRAELSAESGDRLRHFSKGAERLLSRGRPPAAQSPTLPHRTLS